MSSFTERSRNLRVVRIRKSDILSMFCWEDLKLPKLRNLPVGAKICDVTYQPEYDAFAILVEHPSFSAVPDGQHIPALDGIEVEYISIGPVPEPGEQAA